MTPLSFSPRSRGAGFRLKLLAAMMIVVSAITGAGLYVAERRLAAAVGRELQTRFEGELAALHNVRALRYAALTERSRSLARKPRIHAALEDNALDLLYPSARDELRDLTSGHGQTSESRSPVLRAEFYRFLDQNGAVIPPPSGYGIGALSPSDEAQLALNTVPLEPQIGCLAHSSGTAGEVISEVVAVPILSSETQEPIAALVLGFKPLDPGPDPVGRAMQRGVWFEGRLHLPSLTEPARFNLESELSRAIAVPGQEGQRVPVTVNGAPHLFFYQCLNRGSLYRPAFEVCLFSLSTLAERQAQLRWQILGAAGLLLALGFGASHFFSRRLSAPVEQLAADSELNRAQRERAESALEQTSIELQRSARFSADASHQLKTPVAVVRAGLEELLAREDLSPEVREELAELNHQTYRLTGVIDDLLLLSRMDAGRLQLDFAPVDLSRLIDAELDDLSVHPAALEISVESRVPSSLTVMGEKRYTVMIVRNLLENARKYNRPAGWIRIEARPEGESVILRVANAGRPISAVAQERIFERFHRGAAAEDVPGHGLGLNLGRELARLHGGDLRLVRSDESGTEFEVRFRLAVSAAEALTEVRG